MGSGLRPMRGRGIGSWLQIAHFKNLLVIGLTLGAHTAPFTDAQYGELG